MFPAGHYGMALVLYAGVGATLLWRGYRDDAFAGGAVVLLFTLHPDLDSHIGALDHRGVTHTLWFAVGIGALCVVAVANELRDRPTPTAVRGGAWAFTLGALAIVAHLSADVLTPWGIAPLYPLVDASYTLGITTAGNPVSNAALLAAGLLGSLAGVRATTWHRNRMSRPSAILRRVYGYVRGVARR